MGCPPIALLLSSQNCSLNEMEPFAYITLKDFADPNEGVGKTQRMKVAIYESATTLPFYQFGSLFHLSKQPAITLPFYQFLSLFRRSKHYEGRSLAESGSFTVPRSDYDR